MRFLALGEVVVALFGSGFLAACGSGHKAKSTSLVPPDGKSGLDVAYALRLGDDSIPALVTALPALDPSDRAALLRRLLLRRDALAAEGTTGWPSWNIGRELARRALANLPPR